MTELALYGSFFLTGLAGSLHCVGMCGPILLAFSQTLDGGKQGGGGFLAYHAGRVWTYGLLGFCAGWVGLELRQGSAELGWQQTFSVLVSVLVILTGIVALGLVPGLRLDAAVTGCAHHLGQRPWLAFLSRDPRRVARLLLGAVMGFLPCGLVYSMLLVTSALPSPLHGALGMVCFGAGTVPALSAVVLGSRAVPARLRVGGTRVAAAMIVAVGVFMLLRAILVSPGGGHGHAMP